MHHETSGVLIGHSWCQNSDRACNAGTTSQCRIKQMKPKRVLREPLLHFVVLGSLIFGFLADAEGPDAAVFESRIVISSADVDRLALAWTQRWQRPPTEDELDSMISEAVRERVLYREALALGLDRDDVVIRRHLRQKYEFVTQDLAYDTDPDDATLRAYYSAHSDRYTKAARLSFSHILFSPDRRGETALTDAKVALQFLQTAAGPTRADLPGDPTSLPADFEGVSDREVEAMFGPDFVAALSGPQQGRWIGPIPSGYGLHLVWLSEKVPGERLAFKEVRQRVKDDWVYDQRVSANEAVYRKLLERYEVVVEPTAAATATEGGGS